MSALTYEHPLLEEILGPTQGIPVFQEQAFEIAYAFGADDAMVDDIYQAIKKAKGAGRGAKEAFEEIEPGFYKRAKKFTRDVREAAWKYIQDFQGYGFNKGHASSYGILGGQAGVSEMSLCLRVLCESAGRVS
jgi:error-prone DNA polymerase